MAESEERQKSKLEVEFDEWLVHPMTQRLRSVAEGKLAFLKNQWVMSNFATENAHESVTLNARAIGQAIEMDWLMKLEFEDLYEENEE